MCHRWFEPSKYEGMRQRLCVDPACQRERHRRGCARSRARDPAMARETRLRDRVVQGERPGTAEEAAGRDPRERIDWKVVRDAVGPEVNAVIEETSGVLVEWMRDAAIAQVKLLTRESRRVVGSRPRDVVALPGGPG